MSLQKTFLALLLGIPLLAACSWGDLQSVIAPAPTDTPTATPTFTPTPVPLAARVNGEGIPLSEFEKETARYELAQNRLGRDLSALGDYRRFVLQSMIEERVAAQAASAMGRAILDEQVDAVIADARQARGGASGLESWLKENFYTLDEFREAVRRQLLVQSATDAVAAQVPLTAEQVHARHILVGNLELANALREQILAGKNFGELALTFSQDYSTNASGGDLGWFPRGILTAAEVEEAAFSLAEGETSPVVQSRLGYHLIQVLERDAARPLSASSLETLRRRAVEGWLAQQMQTAQVEIFI
ncbi:MAG: peptidylprolyl isomerase [Anaerolineales bacterium]|nr:peptidylprolyl isomerase [Anaerolineales bacterium]